MRRRDFIAAASGLLGAAAPTPMRLLNLPEMGLVPGGQVFSVLLQQPGPGLAATYTVPANLALEILAADWILACSVTVATRFSTLQVVDNSGTLLLASEATGTGATITNEICFGQGFGASMSNTGVRNISLSRIIAPPGSVINLGAIGLQAGDQISNLRLTGIAYAVT